MSSRTTRRIYVTARRIVAADRSDDEHESDNSDDNSDAGDATDERKIERRKRHSDDASDNARRVARSVRRVHSSFSDVDITSSLVPPSSSSSPSLIDSLICTAALETCEGMCATMHEYSALRPGELSHSVVEAGLMRPFPVAAYALRRPFPTTSPHKFKGHLYYVTGILLPNPDSETALMHALAAAGITRTTDAVWRGITSTWHTTQLDFGTWFKDLLGDLATRAAAAAATMTATTAAPATHHPLPPPLVPAVASPLLPNAHALTAFPDQKMAIETTEGLMATVTEHGNPPDGPLSFPLMPPFHDCNLLQVEQSPHKFKGYLWLATSTPKVMLNERQSGQLDAIVTVFKIKKTTNARWVKAVLLYEIQRRSAPVPDFITWLVIHACLLGALPSMCSCPRHHPDPPSPPTTPPSSPSSSSPPAL